MPDRSGAQLVLILGDTADHAKPTRACVGRIIGCMVVAIDLATIGWIYFM
jgi:hypothetical protein